MPAVPETEWGTEMRRISRFETSLKNTVWLPRKSVNSSEPKCPHCWHISNVDLPYLELPPIFSSINLWDSPAFPDSRTFLTTLTRSCQFSLLNISRLYISITAVSVLPSIFFCLIYCNSLQNSLPLSQCPTLTQVLQSCWRFFLKIQLVLCHCPVSNASWLPLCTQKKVLFLNNIRGFWPSVSTGLQPSPLTTLQGMSHFPDAERSRHFHPWVFSHLVPFA